MLVDLNFCVNSLFVAGALCFGIGFVYFLVHVFYNGLHIGCCVVLLINYLFFGFFSVFVAVFLSIFGVFRLLIIVWIVLGYASILSVVTFTFKSGFELL